jgi:hypothetical protein
MKIVLISTYELGHQPFGLASPAAWLRRAGHELTCIDASQQPLRDFEREISSADGIAFYLPMHTATRIAVQMIPRVREMNNTARLCAYGLYAPMNAELLAELGVENIIGGEFERELAEWISVAPATSPAVADDGPLSALRTGRPQGLPPSRRRYDETISLERLTFLTPDRSRR